MFSWSLPQLNLHFLNASFNTHQSDKIKTEPRNLKGPDRIRWLSGLNGQYFDGLTTEQRYEALSVVTGVLPDELQAMTPEEYREAIRKKKGLQPDEEEQAQAIRQVQSQQEADEYQHTIQNFIDAPDRFVRKLKKGKWQLLQPGFEKFLEWYPPGKIRKDGYTDERLHFFKPIFHIIEALQNNILPHKIKKFYRINEARERDSDITYRVPEEQQSLERTLLMYLFHDTIEDISDQARQDIESHLLAFIKDPTKQELLKKEINALGQGVEYLTYKYKVFHDDGTKEIKSDCELDINLYIKRVILDYAAVLVKSKDKIYGFYRFSDNLLYPDLFKIIKQIDYLKEAEIMFADNRPLEMMAEKYPELGDYITLINATMEVSYRAFGAIIRNHPERHKHIDTRDKGMNVFQKLLETTNMKNESIHTVLSSPEKLTSFFKQASFGQFNEKDIEDFSKYKRSNKGGKTETAHLDVSDFLAIVFGQKSLKSLQQCVVDMYYSCVMQSIIYPELGRVVN